MQMDMPRTKLGLTGKGNECSSPTTALRGERKLLLYRVIILRTL